MSAIKTADGRFAISFSYHEKGAKKGQKGPVLTDSRGRRLIRVIVTDTVSGLPLTAASAACSADEPRFLVTKGRLVALRYATRNKILVPKPIRKELFKALVAHQKKVRLPKISHLSADQLQELRARIDARLVGAAK